MTTDQTQCLGAKVNRLLRIKQLDTLGDLVLPILPIAALTPPELDSLAQADDPVSIYAAAFEQAVPQLMQRVQEVCGPGPWIVRSSGNEDLKEYVNAGGYDSLICHEPSALIQCIAAVATSGMSRHAQRQLALSGQYDYAAAIPCFVQPLLNIGVRDEVGGDHSPYLDTAVIERMEAVCSELMQMFDFTAIDCEWGLDTTLGFVSVTTLMPRNPEQMNTAHRAGFGFASAQTTGLLATSLVVRPAGSDLRLWGGRSLCETTVRSLHLLQARPAYIDDGFRDRQVLTDDCREALIGRYDAVAASLVMLGAQSSGRVLIASDLMSAWRRYLALDTVEQAAVALVLVDEGSAQEHAGIMFSQQRITCVTLDTRRVPAGASCAVFDRGACILGDASLLQSIQSEPCRELVIPDDCGLVFTEDVLTTNGELDRSWVEVLAQLHRLPVAEAVKQRLLDYSEQPMPTRWIHRANGVVQSPSLLAAIWRADISECAGQGRLLQKFAKDYQHAVKTSQDASEGRLYGLSALSSSASILAASGDLRIVMALLACEEAASWLPPQTLSRLLDSAALQLRALQRDNALVILESVAFISNQGSRLPFHTQADTIRYLEVLAKCVAEGVPVEAVVSIRSLALTIASETLMMQQALEFPGTCSPVVAFQQALESFRWHASGGEEAARLAQELNNCYSKLRNTLREASLDNVAEQIRGSLIETYDASLKGLLCRAVEGADVVSYHLYLELMKRWIEYLSIGPLSERDTAVFQHFQVWLRQWTNEPLPQSFEIQDRNWRFEFDSINSSGKALVRYENPHVLHNLLHQYALATLRLDTEGLPERVQALEHFCSTFSSRATKVLRFERELLEIQIPMGTHKASYVFTPRQLSVEWTEPPDCPDGEIARILAFEVVLDKLRIWMFPGLTIRRERVLGTWTLFLRLNAHGSHPWDYDQLFRFVVATRLLFDASYDFSYVANETVETFARHFHGPQWQALLATLIRHRSLIEDASQYVALHALPLSSTIAAIAQSRVVRGLLLRCQRRGFDYCRGVIDSYASWLDRETGTVNQVQWSQRYESLRQASLFLAARWPAETLAVMAGQSAFNVGDDLVAASLLKRSDLANDIRRLVAGSPLALAGVAGMIVRHAPETAVTIWGAARVARQLAGTGLRFRRAKHLLVARFAEHLGQDLLAALLSDLETIPWGRTASAEQAIQVHLTTRGRAYRFELEKGLDWTSLDTWQALAQKPPSYQ